MHSGTRIFNCLLNLKGHSEQLWMVAFIVYGQKIFMLETVPHYFLIQSNLKIGFTDWPHLMLPYLIRHFKYWQYELTFYETNSSFIKWTNPISTSEIALSAEFRNTVIINPVSANPTKWSNTFTQFVRLALKGLKKIGAKLQTCSKRRLERCFPGNRNFFPSHPLNHPRVASSVLYNDNSPTIASFINKLLEPYLRKNHDEMATEKYSCFMIILRKLNNWKISQNPAIYFSFEKLLWNFIIKLKKMIFFFFTFLRSKIDTRNITIKIKFHLSYYDRWKVLLSCFLPHH